MKKPQPKEAEAGDRTVAGRTAAVHKEVAAEAAKVAVSANQLKQTAKAVENSSQDIADSADLTTRLAADRTVLAGERTYAAWVRTGLASLASGVGARALVQSLLPDWFGQIIAAGLILFSIFCFVAAVWRELAPGVPPPRPTTRRMPRLALIIVNGFLVVVGIAVLIAIWVVPAPRVS